MRGRLLTNLLPGRLAVLILACAVAPAFAQDAARVSSRDDVSAQLTVVTEVRAADGFRPDTQALGRSTLLGVLEDGSSVYLEVPLDAAREYHIEARCDSGCGNLDMRMLGPAFDPVAEDIADNDQPKMDVTASSGPHLLAVQMTSCAARICYFGIVVLSRPAR